MVSQLNAINAKGQLILTLKSLGALVSEMGVTYKKGLIVRS